MNIVSMPEEIHEIKIEIPFIKRVLKSKDSNRKFDNGNYYTYIKLNDPSV